MAKAMKYIYLMVLTVLLMAGCDRHKPTADKADDNYQAADSATLKVAVMPTLDCLPLYVAESCGLFEQQGADIRLVPFMAQMDCDTAFARGHVEAMVTDLVRAERLRQQGIKVGYVTATDLSWLLLTAKHARIKQLKQLDDKMIAMTRFSATAMQADQLVDSAGLATERVFRIQVNNVLTRLNMLENGIMDAMLLPEPQATTARLAKHPVVMDSRDKGIWLGVVAARPSCIADNFRQQQVRCFVGAYNAACDSISHFGLQHYAGIIKAYCHVDDATVKALPKILFPHVAAPRQRDIDRTHNVTWRTN